MTEKILKNNQAVVAGEIISDFEFSHEVFGEGFYFVKLKVSRLSHSSDIIPLLVSERLIDVSQSHIGQFLEARGQFRSYNKHENNRNHLVLSLFVRELELIDSVENRKPNMIFLDGYICKEPVYRTTPLGREIADVQDVFDLHRLTGAAGNGGRIAAADFQHAAADGTKAHNCNFSHEKIPLSVFLADKAAYAPRWISTTQGWRDRRGSISSTVICMVPVRTVTSTWAAPFSGRDWVMVTMDAPAAEMPDSSPCSAPVLSSSVATTVMDSRPVSASNTVSLYL